MTRHLESLTRRDLDRLPTESIIYGHAEMPAALVVNRGYNVIEVLILQIFDAFIGRQAEGFKGRGWRGKAHIRKEGNLSTRDTYALMRVLNFYGKISR
ncbi:hypothetical protein [Streptomyces cyaneofuscatus]|uniref:hypothetical protein n=1 Tax=Streptomyces cyaneofuscatus TaxID=66883 RepID=UPI0033B157F8